VSEKKAINASTIARIAGNIMSGYRGGAEQEEDDYIQCAVSLARRIAAEVERTEEGGVSSSGGPPHTHTKNESK